MTSGSFFFAFSLVLGSTADTNTAVMFQPRSYVLEGGIFSTVDAKCFCARKFCHNSKAYELSDGSIVTVGVKSFRHAGVLSQPEVLFHMGCRRRFPR